MKKRTSEQSYLTLLEFLLTAKQQLFEISAQHGLSGMQAIALLLLCDEPRPMSSFKHLLNCDASNVTGIIDGLQQRHLVTRYEHPEDRRVKVVKLLAKGRTLRTTLLRQLTSPDDYLLAGLNSAEAGNFMALVRKLTDA